MSAYIPVLKSLVSAEALAKLIQNVYGLREVRCQLIQATMRDVYLATSNRKAYVLFVYRHNERTQEEITAEWSYIDYLHTQKVPVAPAVRQNSGELILAIDAPEGTRYAVLSDFVDGQHLRQRYSIGAVRQYGRSIAQIHTLSDLIPNHFTRPCNDFYSVVEQSLTALAPLLSHRPHDMNYLQKVSAIIEPKFNTLPREAPYYGMIHGDVIRANAQVSDDNRITVLDFDLCGLGWRAYDVASYLEVAGTDEAREAFVEGYQEVRKLSDAELNLLPLFEAARHIFSLGVPAVNIQQWGRAHLADITVDASLHGLRHCMGKVV